MKTNTVRNRATTSLGAIAIACLIGTSAPALAADDVDLANEITVTARKREENLLSTPIAISAMTTKDIEQRGIVSLTDLVEATPGINVTGNNSGRNDRSFQQITMRGFAPTTTDSTLVATFIDGVPVSSATALNAISDPARVEVLKGPQNAYFGRNAFAGAINVVNKLPADRFGGAFSASAFSRGGYDMQGSIEGPLAGDVLGFRLAGRSFQKGGSYINGADKSERLGDQRSRSGNLTLVFRPSADFTIKAFGLYSEDKDGPSAQGMLSAYEVRSNNGMINIPALTGSTAGTIIVPNLSNCTFNGLQSGVDATETRTLNPFICGAVPALPAGYSPSQNTYVNAATSATLANGAYRPAGNNGVDGYGLKRRYMHAHINMDYDIGETGLTVSSLTGFNDERFSELSELDNYDSSSLINPNATASNGLLPYWNYPFAIERVNRDFSQELRLSFDNKGPLTAMFGANYLWTKSYRGQLNVQAETVNGATRLASSLTAPQQVRTYGLFGSINYDVTEKLAISLEGRYQRDKIYAFAGGNGATVSAGAAAATGIPAGAYPALTSYFNKTFNNFMPRVIVNYKVTPDIMAYASWSKAANTSVSSFNARLFSGTPGEITASQGLGLQPVTIPEKLTNYELGLKGKLFNGRMTFALAGYMGEWKNQYNNRQIYFLDTSVTPERISTVTGLANTGRTLMKGVELDVTAIPADGISLTFSGAYTDTNVRSYTFPTTSRLTGLIGNDFVGKSLAYSSKYSFSFSPAFTGDIPGRDNSTWFIRSDVNYKSKQFLDVDNLTWIKGRAVVNGRIGVTLDKVSLELFATNLLNDRNYVSVQAQAVQHPTLPAGSVPTGTPTSLALGARSYVIVGLPELRTFGVKASVKF